MSLPIKIDLPDHYLDEEIRWDFKITTERKKIWAVEMDLFCELKRVCDKYNIKFFADGGTLLGVIRHKGFIPWDDDMDFIVLRKDYEKLCNVAPLEFKFPYFFQTEDTDPTSCRGHAQLRNSLTTGMLQSEAKNKKIKFNQGIFIDIFPADSIPDDEEQCRKFYLKTSNILKKSHKILHNTLLYYRSGEHNGHFDLLRLLYRDFRHTYYKMTHADYKKYYNQFIEACLKYDSQETKFIACLLFSGVNLDSLKLFRQDYLNPDMGDFEFLKMPIPQNPKRNLINEYGQNYMIPVKGTSLHGSVVFDPETPYLDYISRKR